MITAISRLDCGSQADPYTQDTLTSDPDELVEDEAPLSAMDLKYSFNYKMLYL
jgi:hypothetical protein